MGNESRDATGARGEKIVCLALTERGGRADPLFRPGYLGDKWPAIDFYVELNATGGIRPYFFVQAKATSADLPAGATHVRISSKGTDIDRLLRTPGPTYLFAVHEPTGRVFVRSVHAGMAARAITRVPIRHELTVPALRRLYDEVRRYWTATHHKPATSEFS